jgi:hypothetical protein
MSNSNSNKFLSLNRRYVIIDNNMLEKVSIQKIFIFLEKLLLETNNENVVERIIKIIDAQADEFTPIISRPTMVNIIAINAGSAPP